MITIIMKDETYNEDLTIKNDKHFDYNYHHYSKIDKGKIINYTINDRIIIIIHKIINLNSNNPN